MIATSGLMILYNKGFVKFILQHLRYFDMGQSHLP